MRIIQHTIRKVTPDRICEWIALERPAVFWLLMGATTVIILQCVIKLAWLSITGKGTV